MQTELTFARNPVISMACGIIQVLVREVFRINDLLNRYDIFNSVVKCF